jgi:hypothetical protein
MATVQRKLVHKQFNSPIALYSDVNIKDTLDRELKTLGNGVVGWVNFLFLSIITAFNERIPFNSYSYALSSPVRFFYWVSVDCLLSHIFRLILSISSPPPLLNFFCSLSLDITSHINFFLLNIDWKIPSISFVCVCECVKIAKVMKV